MRRLARISLMLQLHIVPTQPHQHRPLRIRRQKHVHAHRRERGFGGWRDQSVAGWWGDHILNNILLLPYLRHLQRLWTPLFCKCGSTLKLSLIIILNIHWHLQFLAQFHRLWLEDQLLLLWNQILNPNLLILCLYFHFRQLKSITL